MGDFNEDGKPDVAVTNRYSSPATVSLLLGNGDGTLQAKLDYAVGGAPKQVASADFDRDGHLDLAVAENTNGKASVLLGNGDGTFDPKQEYAAGTGSEAIATGDFNGDNVLDIAVGNWDGNNVSILIGNGNGTFAAGVNYAAGSQPHDLAVGDWNGDGKPDLAVADYIGNTVSVLLGAGDGTFAAKTSYGVASVASSVEHADVNGDGHADLVVADFGSDEVRVMLGKGDGTFVDTTGYAVGHEPNSVVAADFNGDGVVDFAVANSQGNVVLDADPPSTVSVLTNTRLSTPPSTSYSNLAEGVWYFHVRAVDAGGVGGTTVHRAVRVDLTPPVTTDDAPAGLVDHAVTVTLTPDRRRLRHERRPGRHLVQARRRRKLHERDVRIGLRRRHPQHPLLLARRRGERRDGALRPCHDRVRRCAGRRVRRRGVERDDRGHRPGRRRPRVRLRLRRLRDHRATASPRSPRAARSTCVPGSYVANLVHHAARARGVHRRRAGDDPAAAASGGRPRDHHCRRRDVPGFHRQGQPALRYPRQRR